MVDVEKKQVIAENNEENEEEDPSEVEENSIMTIKINSEERQVPI